MTDPEPYSKRQLIYVHAVVAVLVAIGCGLLLYFRPAIGEAVVGALTTLEVLLIIASRRD